MPGILGFLCFLSFMGAAGAVETGESPLVALVLIAITLPATYIACKLDERREKDEHRNNHGDFSSGRIAKY